MNKYLIIAILIFTQSIIYANVRYDLYCNRHLLERSHDSLMSQVGVREASGRNDGEVEKYLHSVGLKKGNPYCAAGQYWCFMVAADALGMLYDSIPIPRSGVANAVFNFAMQKGKRAEYVADKHFLIVWRENASYRGHIERIIATGKAGWVTTVGFNTSSANGNQADGEGVFVRKRNIYHPLGRLKIRGIIGFYSM